MTDVISTSAKVHIPLAINFNLHFSPKPFLYIFKETLILIFRLFFSFEKMLIPEELV